MHIIIPAEMTKKMQQRWIVLTRVFNVDGSQAKVTFYERALILISLLVLVHRGPVELQSEKCCFMEMFSCLIK